MTRPKRWEELPRWLYVGAKVRAPKCTGDAVLTVQAIDADGGTIDVMFADGTEHFVYIDEAIAWVPRWEELTPTQQADVMAGHRGSLRTPNETASALFSLIEAGLVITDEQHASIRAIYDAMVAPYEPALRVRRAEDEAVGRAIVAWGESVRRMWARREAAVRAADIAARGADPDALETFVLKPGIGEWGDVKVGDVVEHRDEMFARVAIRGDEPLKIQFRGGHTDFKMTQKYIERARNLPANFGTPFPELPASLWDGILPSDPQDHGSDAELPGVPNGIRRRLDTSSDWSKQVSTGIPHGLDQSGAAKGRVSAIAGVAENEPSERLSGDAEKRVLVVGDVAGRVASVAVAGVEPDETSTFGFLLDNATNPGATQ